MAATPPARPRITVCMAAYNGSRYIEEQLRSILDQLEDGDEVIVVDDCSTDDTASRVASLDDARIRLVRAAANAGYVKTFERAISLATGEVVFLSDQDDIWLPGRVDVMVEALDDAELVVTNFSYFGGEIPTLQQARLSKRSSRHWLRNTFWIWVGTRPYYGCCMAFRHSLIPRLLPFPEYLSETHDQWIGFVANADKSVAHLDFDSVARRIHADNATVKSARPMSTVLKARWMTARSVLEARKRSRRFAR